MSQIAMLHEKDPRDEILSKFQTVSKMQLCNNQVLCAVYIRPEKTKGGIVLADQTRNEDRYQSKVGLIIAKGPDAFVDDSGRWFNGLEFKLHDWIVFRPSDGWSITVDGILCRMLNDVDVRARIDNPDQVY
jgi:co-chaperonin GroES (HSP10)